MKKGITIILFLSLAFLIVSCNNNNLVSNDSLLKAENEKAIQTRAKAKPILDNLLLQYLKKGDATIINKEILKNVGNNEIPEGAAIIFRNDDIENSFNNTAETLLQQTLADDYKYLEIAKPKGPMFFTKTYNLGSAGSLRIEIWRYWYPWGSQIGNTGFADKSLNDWNYVRVTDSRGGDSGAQGPVRFYNKSTCRVKGPFWWWFGGIEPVEAWMYINDARITNTSLPEIPQVGQFRWHKYGF